MLASKSISKITELKGKKVAYAPLSPSDFLISYALKVNGMSDKDISPVNMTPEAIPSAMASAAVPVGVTYEPNVSQILALDGGSKFHVIYSSKDAPDAVPQCGDVPSYPGNGLPYGRRTPSISSVPGLYAQLVDEGPDPGTPRCLC